MSVERYLVRLYQRSSYKRVEREVSLSLSNEDRLARLLEKMVEVYVGERKMRRTDLSNGWTLRIYRINSSGGTRGRHIAEAKISTTGEPEVIR